ncbi:hypothetical protein Agub_g10938, partial [Astrephomene gubernaculifera]
MGLAKVLLGHLTKEAGLPKCARVDSVGLAKRRLAAKAAQEDREELIIVEPDEEVAAQDAASGVRLAAGTLPSGQDRVGPEDLDMVAVFTSLENRQLRDSLRIHRRRFRQRRASVDDSSHPQVDDAAKRSSSSSVELERPPNAHVRHSRASASGYELSQHIRVRRASDGEFLSRTFSKSAENGRPNALKAVQLKAERLFRRLTGNLVEHPRSRSVTPSHAASPPLTTTSQRHGGGGGASRGSFMWAAFARRHTGEIDGDDRDDPSSPT